MVGSVPQCILVLVLVKIAAAFVFNYTLDDDDDLMVLKNRRQGGLMLGIPKKAGSESTSSDGKRPAEGGSGSGGSSESLQQSFTGETSSDTGEVKRKKKDRMPKSSPERRGWRKWHRKCTQCQEEMNKKWRDPSIKWICGAYQRARRSFKSSCMMHYRNCQDGTMFTKVSDHRCPNATSQVRPYGDHFFYDYNVVLTDDATQSGEQAETSEEESSSSSWDTSRIAKLPPLPAEA